MRILLVNDSLQRIGGAEAHFWDLHDLLKEQGYQVDIFGVDAPENFASWFSRWWSWKYARELQVKLEQFKPEVVHFHNVVRCLSPSVVAQAKGFGAKTLLTVHDPNLIQHKLVDVCRRGPLRRINGVVAQYFQVIGCWRFFLTWPFLLLKRIKASWQARVLARAVDLFIFPSELLMKLHIEHLKLDPCCCCRLPYFASRTLLNKGQDARVITSKRDRTLEGANVPRKILYMGRLVPEKGVDVLMQAFAQLRAEMTENSMETELHIVGSGPELAKLGKLAQRLEITEQVIFYGKLAGSQLTARLMEADLVIVPSLWLENYPMSVIEALAFGKPVVASNIGGLPELISNRKNGLLVEPGDIEGLRRVLFEALNYFDRSGLDPSTVSLFTPEDYFKEYQSACSEQRSLGSVPAT